jgi:hypothetical protein
MQCKDDVPNWYVLSLSDIDEPSLLVKEDGMSFLLETLNNSHLDPLVPGDKHDKWVRCKECLSPELDHER